MLNVRPAFEYVLLSTLLERPGNGSPTKFWRWRNRLAPTLMSGHSEAPTMRRSSEVTWILAAAARRLWLQSSAFRIAASRPGSSK